MILRQFLHSDPVGASYLLGCGGMSAAAVVDPMGDSSRYVGAAEELGVKIVYVIDTHLHADHVSVGSEVAELTGAEYVLSARSDVSFTFKPVNHDDVLELGNVSLRVLHTPGHTPEHISLVVTDRSRAEEPWFVLTGHTLMVGDMGRTELASSEEQGARDLFRSAKMLKQLPDYVEVLPGAFSGSICGRGLSGKPFSTIGFERRHNPLLKIEDEEEFVRVMTADAYAPAADAAKLRAKNSGKVGPQIVEA